jgi:hypothetical protein
VLGSAGDRDEAWLARRLLHLLRRHAPVQPGRQWPTFTAEAGKLGARAVFAFPLAIGVRHQARRFDLFIDAIRKAGNFHLALARLPH